MSPDPNSNSYSRRMSLTVGLRRLRKNEKRKNEMKMKNTMIATY